MNHVITRHGGVVCVKLPLRTQSETNMREHWSSRHRRRASQRQPVALVVRAIVRELALPVEVILVRIAPRRLDDDNLRGALKAVRDGVADAFGADDGDRKAYRWRYDQRRGAPSEYAVEIALRRATWPQDAPADPPSGVVLSGE